MNPRDITSIDVKAANDKAYAYEYWCRAVDYHVHKCTGVASEDYPPPYVGDDGRARMRRWFKLGIEASEVAACVVHEIVRGR